MKKLHQDGQNVGIVRLFGTLETNTGTGIVTEYADFEPHSLQLYISNRNCGLGGQRILNFSLEMLHALEFITSRDLIHNDFNPSNVLVFKRDGGEPMLKLCDFGSASSFCAAYAYSLQALATVEHVHRGDGLWDAAVHGPGANERQGCCVFSKRRV